MVELYEHWESTLCIYTDQLLGLLVHVFNGLWLFHAETWFICKCLITIIIIHIFNVLNAIFFFFNLKKNLHSFLFLFF